MLQTFHFLRPEWFLAIIPVIALLFTFIRHSNNQSAWSNACDPSLLHYQLAQQTLNLSHSTRLLYWFVPLSFLLTIIALAGPTWEKKDQPVFQQGSALVIILDLSLSMNARDIKPSRLERAKLKIIDILKQKKEGQTALIAFAGDAHTASPLTIDNKTIMSLLPALDTSIMPMPGSHVSDALLTAKQLFMNAGFTHGDILLMTDGINSMQEKQLKTQVKELYQQGYSLSIIGIGSPAGSPIPLSDQAGFIKDSTGQVILSKLTSEPLQTLARKGGGSYHTLSLDDQDFKALLGKQFMGNQNIAEQDNQIEQWVDAGAYVTLLLLPFALLAFRKGLLSISLFLIIAPVFFSEPTFASSTTWNNLWSTPNQQGQKAFNNQDYQKSAEQFVNKNWKAGSYYRSGEFDNAVEQYSQSDDAENLYNKGNSLANLQKFEEAIQSYEQALEKDPQLHDATQNRDYLKELLAEQQNQQSSQQSSQEQSDQKQSSQEQSNQEQSNQEQSSQEQSSQEQSNSSDEQTDDQKQQDSSEKNNKDSNQTDKNSEEKKAGESSSDSGDSESKEDNDRNQGDSEQDQKNQSGQSDSQQNEADSSDQIDPRNTQEGLSADELASESDQQTSEPDQQAQSESSAEQDEQEKSAQEGTQDTADENVMSQLSQEEQQSLKQWLQRIPDNPGQLLRIKFRNNSIIRQRSQNAPEQYKGNPW